MLLRKARRFILNLLLAWGAPPCFLALRGSSKLDPKDLQVFTMEVTGLGPPALRPCFDKALLAVRGDPPCFLTLWGSFKLDPKDLQVFTMEVTGLAPPALRPCFDKALLAVRGVQLCFLALRALLNWTQRICKYLLWKSPASGLRPCGLALI